MNLKRVKLTGVSSITFVVTLALLALILPSDLVAQVRGNRIPTRLKGALTPSSQAESLSSAFQSAADTVLPSVVKIKTRTARGQRVLINGVFPMDLPDSEGLGSGVIIDPAGVVMTNNHVVKDADEVIVELQDGTELYATEYTTDPLTDLAIVRVKARERLPFARFGDSDALQVGDWVLAVGHPLELETSVSAGIISAKGRSLGDKAKRASFLQTDAAINPGNSGGPLVNLRGEIVGINTAIASQTGGYQGIGFAVPANLARDVVRHLRDDGTVARGYLGVSIQKLTKDLSQQLLANPNGKGVIVNSVSPSTPAQQAGIRPGDVITNFANYPVDSPSALQRAVERVPIGSQQRLTFVRFQQPMQTDVYTLRLPEEQLKQDDRGVTKKLRIPIRDNSSPGFQVADLEELAGRQGIRVNQNAVVIVRVNSDSLAADEGLRPGMIVRQVRNQPVRDVQEFNTAIRNESLADGILLLVKEPGRDGTSADRFVVLRAYQ